LAPPASSRRRPSLEGDVLTQPRRHRSLLAECRRHFQVAHPRLMWSYDSAKNRDLRVRSVVERSMREGLGAEEVVFRPDMHDSADGVAQRDVSASILTSDSDLIASPEDGLLSMAEARSSIDPVARGRDEPLHRSVVSGVLSDVRGSTEMGAVLQDLSTACSSLTGAPVKMVAEGEEFQKLAACSTLVLSDHCRSVSSPQSSTVIGPPVDDSQVRGAVKGLPMVVSSLIESDGGQAMGRLGDGLIDAYSAANLETAGLVHPLHEPGADSMYYKALFG
ncbi:hypothetical protein Dimus_017939, partial [Dionaea muscipula]